MSGKALTARTPSTDRPAHQRGLRIGNPGNRGGGDHPDTYKLWHKRLLESETARAQYEAILQDNSHPAFLAAWKNSEERTEGKVPQPVQAMGDMTLRIVVTRE